MNTLIKKNSLLYLILLLILPFVNLSAQGSKILFEDTGAEIDGVTIYLDGIWISEGVTKADIAFFRGNSKSYSGGYGLGDTIKMSGDNFYVVSEIFKTGTDNKGFIVLSPAAGFPDYLYNESYELYEGSMISTGNLFLEVRSLNNDSGIITARNVIYDSVTVSDYFVFYNNDTVWLGSAAYTAAINNDKLTLQKVSELYTAKTNVLPGELYNRPNIQPDSLYSSSYIIKKIGYFTGKRDDPDPPAIWLLKIESNENNQAMPVTEIIEDGKKLFVPFSFVRKFETEDEARTYARLLKIKYIYLDGD